jgi:hypothetical protein
MSRATPGEEHWWVARAYSYAAHAVYMLHADCDALPILGGQHLRQNQCSQTAGSSVELPVQCNAVYTRYLLGMETVASVTFMPSDASAQCAWCMLLYPV